MVFRLDKVSFSRSADSIMIASDASVVKHIPITRKQAEEVRRYKPLFHSPIKGKRPENKNNAVHPFTPRHTQARWRNYSATKTVPKNIKNLLGTNGQVGSRSAATGFLQSELTMAKKSS